MSLGMGVPLLIVGASAGKLMPRPGGWMDGVKYFFGVMMLGVAIWMLSRIIPGNITLILWGILLIGTSIYLGALEPLEKDIKPTFKLKKVLGVLLLIYGAIFFIGGINGSTSTLRPLESFKAKVTAFEEAESDFKEEMFIRVTTLKELKEIVKNSKKMVLVDFYADWCTSCVELDETTFKDKSVLEELKEYKLLRVDVTKNSNDDKELMNEFNIFGPPAILFFKSGSELKDNRIIGYKSPKEFLEILKEIKE
jgi:thiol:disulfide interchange protein DsbD